MLEKEQHQILEQSADCAPPEDRQELFAQWTCSQYNTFLDLQHISNINIYVLKTF